MHLLIKPRILNLIYCKVCTIWFDTSRFFIKELQICCNNLIHVRYIWIGNPIKVLVINLQQIFPGSMENSFPKPVQRKRGLPAYVRFTMLHWIHAPRIDKVLFDNVYGDDYLPVSGSYAGHRPGNPCLAIPFWKIWESRAAKQEADHSSRETSIPSLGR